MRNFKSFFLFSIFSLLVFSCSKSKDNKPNGNYFKLNNDMRTLEQIPSSTITVDNGAYTNPDEWQLAMSIKNDCSQIAGLNNGEFEIYIDIWDKGLTKTEYNISAGYSGGGSDPGPSGTASIGMRPFKIGGSGLTFLDAQSGKITIIKDVNGNLKTVDFSNLPLKDLNGNSYTASGSFTVN